MLVGRATEIAYLDDLIAGARVGKAGVLVLRGEAGIGKTALLSNIAADDFTVLRTQGHEVESHVSFGGLATLLEPVARHLPELPDAQAAALAGALRLKPATGGDRLGVGTATLGLIARAAERAPVLLTVDDAHWLDLPSLEAIVFASRRLHAERAAVVIAARTADDTDPDVAAWLDSLPNLAVSGLSERDAVELLDRHAPPLGPQLRRRHLAETMGNPLALLELTAQLDVDSLGFPVEPVAIGRRLEQAFGQRLANCPMSTRRALLLLAVCGGETDALRPLLEAQGLSTAALEPAEIAGLVTAGAGEVAFRHPLMRAAVYQLATPGERREAHRAIALVMAALGTPRAADREVWHLAAATTLPDEQVAGRLERAARSAAERRSYSTAMEMYDVAARLSPAGDSRARRMLSAAELSMQAGRTHAGLSILDRMQAETADQALLTQAVHVRCRIEMWGGKPVVARDRLLDEGLLLAAGEPIWKAVMLSHASLLTVMLGELASAVSTSATAVELVGNLPDQMIMQVLLVHALALAAHGETRAARPLLDRCRPFLRDYDPLSADQSLLIAALAFEAVEQPAEAQQWYRRAVEAAREAGAVGLLPFQLSALALAQWREGAWPAALSTAAEAANLAEETGWRTEIPNSLVALAMVEAGLGRENECRAHAARAVQIATATGARIIDIKADIALALLELGAGRPEAAARRLERVAAFAAANDLGDPLLLGWAADAVEAGVRGGRPKLADEALAVLQAEAHRSGRPTALARAARGRALLADDPRAAEAAIDEALAHHAMADWPFEEARTRLVHGELLRRDRKRARARAALERSADMFERLGAVEFANRAGDELRAVGGSTRPRSATTGTDLTPQETNVALVVAGGATNAEAAARLFLSEKTIEYHLSSVYRKLGIRSRSQLARAVTP
ncbi:MAG TPA: AAA family ATPase [Actinophytocola sp.]|uniref:AAA family ATPase n=1 Tax=Actinophytocola sp. TaxID=1872138 RepID=UPI002DB8E737|nr:AAA family ATPase [Actinophytocola sp.]HEU5473501.1 AAA family ATPase [Actinophytocola sp.]